VSKKRNSFIFFYGQLELGWAAKDEEKEITQRFAETQRAKRRVRRAGLKPRSYKKRRREEKNRKKKEAT
jgi:hypothetical protein